MELTMTSTSAPRLMAVVISSEHVTKTFHKKRWAKLYSNWC